MKQTSNSRSESQKHYIMEEARLKDDILYYSIYMAFWNRKDCRDRKPIHGCQEL